MIVYYVAYGMLFLLYCEKKIKNNSNTKKTLSIVFFVIFTLLLGFRHPSMGVDLGYGTSEGYLQSFKQISRMSWKTVLNLESFLNYERGYIIFNKILGILSDNVQILLFAIALISFALISRTLYKLSDNRNIFMAIIIYTALPCFLIQFSGLRQAIAIAICAIAMQFIESRKFIPFILLVLVASLFHTTALCFFPAYFAYVIPVNRKWRFGTFAILALIFVLRVPLFQVLVRLIGRSNSPDYNGAITLFLVFTLVYLFCSMFETEDKRMNGYMNLFYLACVCQAFSGVYSSAMRMGYYYMISLSILLPMAIDNILEFRQRELVRLLVYVCFLAFGLYTLSSKTGWAMTNPYHFFWQNIYG